MMVSEGVPTLLQLSIEAMASWMFSVPAAISSLPFEPDLGRRLFEAHQVTLEKRIESGLPVHFQQQLTVVKELVSQFWQGGRLEVAHRPAANPEGLQHLDALSHRLQHLALQCPMLPTLHPLQHCTSLTCLSLRGCTALADTAHIRQLQCLTALDVSGCSQLTDVSVSHVAQLRALQQLNLSGTRISDAAMDMLTYGLRARGWQQQSPAIRALPAEAAAWPPLLQLSRVQVAWCPGITCAGLLLLTSLSNLVLLDARGTGKAAAALVALQHRFPRLTRVQPAVLSSSSGLAHDVINRDLPPCTCGIPGAELHVMAIVIIVFLLTLININIDDIIISDNNNNSCRFRVPQNASPRLM
jgi:hypothetical protein